MFIFWYSCVSPDMGSDIKTNQTVPDALRYRF